jgi:hypothetical protein
LLLETKNPTIFINQIEMQKKFSKGLQKFGKMSNIETVS